MGLPPDPGLSRTVLRRLAAHFDLPTPPQELVVATPRAIADATAFDEREAHHNFDYDDEAYEEVHQNRPRLVALGPLQPAMELSRELMTKGSSQVEMSDEGLMTDDLEACFGAVLEGLQKCDLPAAEVVAWCGQMIKRDRVGFICDQELWALRQRLEASESS